MSRRRAPHAASPLPVDDRVPRWLPGRTRWCPRGGDGHAAAHLDPVALRQQVQRGIEPMQAVEAQTHNLHRAEVSAWLSCSRGSEHSTPLVPLPSAGPGLFRAALVATCAPTPGPAGAVPVRVRSRIGRASWTRGRAIREDSIGRCARLRLGGSMQGTQRGTSNVRPWNPVVTAIAGLPPSHGTVRTPRECPEGSAVRRPKVGAVTRLGWLRWPGSPEIATGETHPRASP